MTTIDQLKTHAADLMTRLKAGETLTKREIEIIEIYNRYKGKKAGNAGKRTKKNHNKNW